MKLSPELKKARDEIERIAAENGLDFFPLIFELVDFEQMNELAALDGFPVRFPHWNFAMNYDHLRKSYALGFLRIYEIVLNTNPCVACLLQGNSLTEQKLVMAHVFAHSDFFKNNVYFKNTNRGMLDTIANHASQIKRMCERHGAEKIEKFLDICLSLQNLIDLHRPFVTAGEQPAAEIPTQSNQFRTRPDLEACLNPENGGSELKIPPAHPNLPEKPESDILLFLLKNAPLTSWQETILSIIRDEAYYFAPQGQTKIINEGWATYWHSKLMTQKILSDAAVIDYANSHAAALATDSGVLNPYKLGVELFRDIEARWDDGRFGPEYSECDDLNRKLNWNQNTGLGQKKIFEVRQLLNDLAFIDTFLTEEFCRRHHLFAYEYNAVDRNFEASDRSFPAVKNKLLQSLTNMGSPKISVVDGNYRHQRELFLLHAHDGIDLKIDEARETLVNLFQIWQRPVYLETVVGESRCILEFNGREPGE
jgi:stage V sporulation protein R